MAFGLLFRFPSEDADVDCEKRVVSFFSQFHIFEPNQ